MARHLLNWIVLVIAVAAADYFLGGITHDTLATLAVAALVLSLLNMVLKPILSLLALPFIILTLGLFFLVINALLLKLTAFLVPGFHVATWGDAFWGGLIISVVHLLLGPGRPEAKVITRRADVKVASQDRNPPPGKGPVIDI
jgi:putative membrane protein